MLRRVALYTTLAVLVVGGVSLAYWLETTGMADEAIPTAIDGLTSQDPAPAPEVTEDDGSSPDIVPTPAATTSAHPVDEVVGAPPPGFVYWGLHTRDVPRREQALDDITEELDARPAIAMFYLEWGTEPLFPAQDAQRLLDRGVIPMVTWEAWDQPELDPSLDPADARAESDQPRYQLDNIIEGEFDPYIRDFARSVRDFEGPVMLRVFHEMDGFWYPWGGTVNGNEPEDVVAAWRHLHDLFEQVGASNVTWVWNVNHESVPDTEANRIDNYWPGDAYVDWTGVSGFNFGTTSEVASWQTFEEVLGTRLVRLAEYDAPIAIAEFASVAEGGDKAAWIRDAFERIVTDHPTVGAAVWFDRRAGTARDWRLTTSDAALEAFREAVARDDVLSAPSALTTVLEDAQSDSS